MKGNKGTGQQISWRSLTFQLLAVVVFPLIVIILAITFSSTSLHQNAMRDLVGERDERAVRMASTAIEDQVQRRANEIRALAGQVTGRSEPQVTALLEKADYLHADFDGGLAVFIGTENRIAVQGAPAVWEDRPDVIAEGIAALAADPGPGLYFSEVPASTSQSQAFFIVMAPSADQQSVTMGAFYLSPLVDRVFENVFTLDPDTSLVMVAQDGAILFQKGFQVEGKTVKEHVGVAEALDGNYGKTYTDIDGDGHVVAYSSVQRFGWALVMEEPWEGVTSPALETSHMAPLVLVPVLLLALLAVFFGIRQIVQPLQTLSAQSSRLGWGDYAAIEKPVGGVMEIRQLQQELIHMAHKLSNAQQSLRSYIGAITSGQEEERRRLARELHDDTIQSLIAFKQRVQLVEMDWEGHPITGALADLERVAEQTIENLRRMVSALRPIYLEDLGLVAAIDMLAKETGAKLGSPVDFKKQGKEKRLDAPVELALYRIVQEALSNITRHSGATHAFVTLSYQAQSIQIAVDDNGKGFQVPRSPAELAPGGHFGLLGMFERVDLIGGEIQVESTSEKGTRLTVTVPYAVGPTSIQPRETPEGLPNS